MQAARRLVSAIQMEKVGYEENSAEITKAKKSKAEADMFQADLRLPSGPGQAEDPDGQT